MAFLDWLDDVKSEFRNRIKSPFYGTFAIVWAAINWRIIYILLFVSDENGGLDKMELIENHLSNWYLIFLKPFWITFVVIAVAPPIQLFAYLINQLWKAIRNWLDKKIGQKTYSAEDYNSLQKLYTKAQTDKSNIEKEANIKIQLLQSEIANNKAKEIVNIDEIIADGKSTKKGIQDAIIVEENDTENSDTSKSGLSNTDHVDQVGNNRDRIRIGTIHEKNDQAFYDTLTKNFFTFFKTTLNSESEVQELIDFSIGQNKRLEERLINGLKNFIYATSSKNVTRNLARKQVIRYTENMIPN